VTLKSFPGSGEEVEEPDWKLLIPDQTKVIHGEEAESNSRWRERAHREWLRISMMLLDAGTLGPENRHQIQRLVVAYIRYDRAAAKAFQLGMVLPSPKTLTPMVNLWQVEMRQADSDATTAEMELGITPRRRAAVGKARRAEKVQRPSDRYLAKSAS
jgi:phage terminase small subunit